MQLGTSLMMLVLGVTADLTGAYRTALLLTGLLMAALGAAFALMTLAQRRSLPT
jgi:hypothetical protein